MGQWHIYQDCETALIRLNILLMKKYMYPKAANH